MQKRAYAILDLMTAEILGNVISLHITDAPAIRQFADAVLAPGSMLARHPEDYALVYLTTIMVEESNNITAAPMEGSRIVMRATDLLASQPNTGTGA